MAQDKQKVLLAVLAGDGNNNIAITNLVYALPYLSHNPEHPRAYSFLPMEGIRPQALARNLCCAEAIKQQVDVLWMIDNDMIPYGDQTLAFLDTPDYDICAPLQYMWWPYNPKEQRLPEAYPVAGMDSKDEKNKITPMWPVKGQPIVAVDWVGSGCIAIKRRVLEDRRMHLAKGMDPPALWRQVYKANHQRVTGLDIDFCRRARKLGYKVKVNWSASVGHYKVCDLNQVDMFAKLALQRGFAAGEKNASDLASKQSGPESGENGERRSKPSSGSAVAQLGMDQAGRRAESAAEIEGQAG